MAENENSREWICNERYNWFFKQILRNSENISPWDSGGNFCRRANQKPRQKLGTDFPFRAKLFQSATISFLFSFFFFFFFFFANVCTGDTWTLKISPVTLDIPLYSRRALVTNHLVLMSSRRDSKSFPTRNTLFAFETTRRIKTHA